MPQDGKSPSEQKNRKQKGWVDHITPIKELEKATTGEKSVTKPSDKEPVKKESFKQWQNRQHRRPEGGMPRHLGEGKW